MPHTDDEDVAAFTEGSIRYLASACNELPLHANRPFCTH